MTPTPVGMRCPECSRQRTKVVRNPGGAPQAGFWGAPATFVLIAINVIVFLIEIAGGSGGLGGLTTQRIFDMGGLYAPAVAEGEWWRLITCGFVHVSVIHIAFNMFLLFMLGRLIEPALGTPRFLLLYFASLIAGSLGALILDPNAVTAGASGAVFGLFGAGFVLARMRGMNTLANELGFLIVFNLIFTFAASNISAGGHLGGLAAGLVCAAAIVAGERGMLGPRHRMVEYAVMVVVGVGCFVGAIAVA
jgi:membrane associated rhomboid family serine protease